MPEEERHPCQPRILPPALRRFAWMVAGMTLLSEGYSWAMWHFFAQRPAYGGTFAWDGAGSDFLIFRERFDFFGTPHFWDKFAYPFTYPAPLAVVYRLLYKLPAAVETYLALSVLALLGWAWFFAVRLAEYGWSRGRWMLLLVLFLAAAWPVRFLLETGNMETVVALGLGAGIVAALRGRWWLGAALIGAVGAMKFYPLTLLGLMLSRRRYKEFVFGLLVAAGVTIASLAMLGPSIGEAQRHIDAGLTFFEQRYVMAPLPDGLQFSHSLFNLVKLGVAAGARLRGQRSAAPHTLQLALAVYVVLTAVLGLFLYVRRIRFAPLLTQAIALTVCAVLLPPFSLDYTLVQLLVPMGLLCVFAAAQWRRGLEPRGLTLCFACFAVIFTTGAYFQLRYRFAAQMRTLALLLLLVTVLHYRYGDAKEVA